MVLTILTLILTKGCILKQGNKKKCCLKLPHARGLCFTLSFEKRLFYKRSVLIVRELPPTKSQLKKVHYYCSKIITPPCALLYHEYPYHAVSTHWLASRDNRSQSLNTRNKVLFRGKIATDNRWRRRGQALLWCTNCTNMEKMCFPL